VGLVGPTELLILALRLGFVVLLYGAVVAVFVALRRDLLRTGRAPAPAPAAPARLTLVEATPVDGGPGRVVPLYADVTIGRRPPADILMQDDAISGRHCRIYFQQGQWLVEDLGSTNGTFVDGRRLAAPVALWDGAVVVAGGTSWRFDAAEGGA
jgi:hypothetical protein